MKRPYHSRLILPVRFTTWRFIIAVALLLIAPLIASAQRFSLDWFTVDSGGGTSTGAVYSVTGTLGQPDVGAMSGDRFSVTGGFWSVIAVVQTPGAPRLAISNTGTNAVVLSWPATSVEFILQKNADLNTTNWVNVAGSPSDSSTNKVYTVSPAAGNSYFRLKNP